MNFLLLRSNQTASPEQPPVQESQGEANRASKPTSTLGGLISEDPMPETTSAENREGDSDGYGNDRGGTAGSSMKNKPLVMDNHVDVTEDEGWITIPYKEIPQNWRDSPDIQSFRSLDRSFIFPGEQIHILACLSACKQHTEIITPFKVAAAMNKNGIRHSVKKQDGSTGSEINSVVEKVEGISDCDEMDHNANSPNDVSSGESLLRMEVQRRQTERLLQRFNNSHFFVRFAESDEALWSTKGAPHSYRESVDMGEQNFSTEGSDKNKSASKKTLFNAFVDRGRFDSSSSGGVARDGVKCCALQNGDIVVLLNINVGVDVLRDPVLEILQFERYQERSLASKSHANLVLPDQDPCGELLRWLLPLDNSIAPPAHSLSPPQTNLSTNIRSTSVKPTLSGSSSSQLFSFGHFRSYSMSSLPPNSAPAPTSTQKPTPKVATIPTPAPTSTPPVAAPSSRTSFDPEDWDHFSFRKSLKSEKSGNEGLLSFRGVPLEPERFSVRCGLEGIYVPGRRWRRKIEIIQPVEIKSFAADCNTDDLLYVQIKNISPAHTPNVVVYIDAISIVSEDASKDGLPSSFPITCIEAGNEYNLPNLALRRGEEHSFILKPAISMWKNGKGQVGGNPQLLHSLSHSSYSEGKNNGPSADHYAILVSCRCNYTESRLFFKQPTSWQPRISRDLMISVASEMSKQTWGSNGRVAQLPVQVLTLQASNLTSEDLTLTVLAPASFTAPPSVMSLSSSPSSPLSPFVTSAEFTDRVSSDRRSMNNRSSSTASTNQVHEGEGGSRSVMFNEQAIPISDVLPSVDLGCTHLWLQSKVPLGCVPSQSTATIKLEVLPLTDGIITLDSLQIDVKEKGLTYIPEHSLKINATSSISTGIV